jgi:hypothetical protein
MPYIIVYFGTLILLAVLSHIQTALAAARSMSIVLATVMVASNSVLLYSLLVLPIFLWREHIRRQPGLALAALAPLALVAIVWPAASQWRLHAFAAKQTAGDFDSWQSMPIRTIAFATTQTRNERSFCYDLCQRLLFSHAVDRVVHLGWGPLAAPNAIGYRIVRKPDCEILHGSHASSFKDPVRARIAAGECLVEEQNVDAETVDLSVIDERFTTHGGYQHGTDPGESIFDRQFFTLTIMKRLTINAGGPHSGRPLFRKTEVQGTSVAMPFVVMAVTFGSVIQPRIQRTIYSANYSVNPYDTLTRRIGLRIPEVSGPPLARVER